MHEIVKSLGPSGAAGLPFFHAFTGCDTVSSFYDIGKLTAWNAPNTCIEIWETFSELSNHPDSIPEISMKAIEKITVLMYNKNSKKLSVN